MTGGEGEGEGVGAVCLDGDDASGGQAGLLIEALHDAAEEAAAAAAAGKTAVVRWASASCHEASCRITLAAPAWRSLATMGCAVKSGTTTVARQLSVMTAWTQASPALPAKGLSKCAAGSGLLGAAAARRATSRRATKAPMPCELKDHEGWDS